MDAKSIIHDDELRSLYLTEWLGQRGYDAERVYYDQGYARRARCCANGCAKSRRATILMASCRGRERLHDAVLSTERQQINENARRACLREWLKQAVRDEMRLVSYAPDEDERSPAAAAYSEVDETGEDRQAIYQAMDRIAAHER
jgi:hypothetical protein